SQPEIVQRPAMGFAARAIRLSFVADGGGAAIRIVIELSFEERGPHVTFGAGRAASLQQGPKLESHFPSNGSPNGPRLQMLAQVIGRLPDSEVVWQNGRRPFEY